MIEALYTIFDLPDAKKTSEFMIRLTENLSMRKTDEVIELAGIMDDYEEKVKATPHNLCHSQKYDIIEL